MAEVTGGVGRGRKTLAGAVAVAFATAGLVLAGPVVPASAYEAATGTWSTPASSRTTLTMPSGITASVTVSGRTTLGDTTTLGGRGFNTSYFNPSTMVTGDSAAAVSVGTTTCASTGVCSGLGTMTVDFSQPVRNPVLQLGGIGGTAPQPTGGGVQSDLHAVLDLTTSGVTLSKLGGNSSLSVASTRITTTTDSVSANCTNTQNSESYLPASGPAACGSVQVNGTVTSVVFSLSVVFVQNPNAVGPYTSDAGDTFAVTVTLPQDFGDAPATYDSTQAPAHIISNLTLGSKVDEDRAGVRNSTSSPFAGTSANGDDNDNTDDEDAFTTLPNILAGVANTYSLTVPLSGVSKAAYLCGYIDLNKGGTFDTTTERACATLASGATSAVLSWSVPATTTVGSTYARFRLGYTQAQVQSPTGLASSGEVEDYPVTLAARPTVTVRKTTSGVAGGPFGFTLTNTTTTTGSVSTSTAGTAATVGTFTVVSVGTAVTISETSSPTSWQLSSARCVDGSGTVVGSLAGSTYTIPAASVVAGATLTCDFTNGRIPPTITVRKTTTGVAGGPFGFTLTNTTQASGSVTTTAAGTATQVDGDPSTGTQPFTVSSIGQQVTITETGLSGWQLSAATCVNASGTTVGSLTGSTYTIPAASVVAGATLTCDFTNGRILPTITVRKTTTGVAGGPFGFTLANTTQASGSVTTTAAGTATQVDGGTSAGTQPFTVSTIGQQVTITETGLSGWRLSSAMCVEDTGTVVGSLAGSTYTIPGVEIRAGASLVCDFTNERILPTITVRKTTTGVAGGPFGFTLTNTTQASGSVTTAAAGTAAQVDGGTSAGTQPFTVSTIGQQVTITENGLSGWQLSAATCVNASGTTVGSLAGSTYTIPADQTGPGATLTCDFTNLQVRQITVVKQGANCDVGVPTCLLAGAQFALYATDPAAPGATPITDGIVADASGSTFASVQLPVDHDYWLVETRAPSGFNLLAQPVKFHLSASQVNLDAASSGALITASTFAITITDVPTGSLPIAGGSGFWPYLVVGLALLTSAGLLTTRRPAAAAAAAGRRTKTWQAKRQLQRSLRNTQHHLRSSK